MKSFSSVISSLFYMKHIYKVFLLGLVFMTALGQQSAKATHVMGADITYKCIDTLKYKFTIKYYRDCRGVAFGNPSGATKIKCKSGSGSTGVSLTRTAIRDVTPVCASATNPCNPKNTYGTGEGIEEHTYTVTIDFNKSGYSQFRKCCKIILETGQCCRNGAITTGAANQNFYTFAELDLCAAPCNSSPALTTEPIAFLCCNQPFFYNNGASDTADFDSLSYSFSYPLRSYTSQIGYSAPYSYKKPFKVYDPGNLGIINPKANPPIGIYLDPETGDLIFTPVKCDETTVAVLEVTEWRKDSTGKPQVIGITRRDMQFWTKTCPDNNPPTINGPYSYNVCAGEQLCFNITTDDKVFKPPPPLPTPDPDTVTITWNRGIPGASFNVVNKKARLQTGRFCWTPPDGAASDLPYTFTVTARDDNCPLNAVSVRAFSVRVKFRAEAERNIDTLICGEYTVESIVPPNFKGNPRYQWQLLDSTGSSLFDRSIGYFKTKGGFLSTLKKDTLKFRQGGTYIIRHEINNAPNCPTVYYDTLVVPPLLEVNLSAGPDTFVCAGTEVRIEPPVLNGISPFKYLWNNGDTTKYTDVYVPSYNTDTLVRIEVTDKNGCVAWDTTRVFLKENPIVKIGPDRRICTYDSILLVPNDSLAYWDDPRDTSEIRVRQGDTLYKEWFRDGKSISTDTTITTSIKGQYIIRVTDSLGCFAEDTMILYVNDTVTAYAGPDDTLCWNDMATLIGHGLDTSGNWKEGTYIWNDLTQPAPNFSRKDTVNFRLKNTTDFELELWVTEDTTTCFNFDTMNIFINQLPILTLPPDQSICCDEGTLTLSGKPAGGKWYDRKNPIFVDGFKDFVTDRACNKDSIKHHFVTYVYTDPVTTCTSEDSIDIQVNPLPKLQLDDGYFCQDKEIVNLNDDIVYIPAALGNIQQWNCLECGSYDWSNILINQGTEFFPDYALRIGEDYFDMGNKTEDSITIELILGNIEGCFSRDTAVILITKVPEITFPQMPGLCYDFGMVDLIDTTNVTPNNGHWIAYDTALVPAPPNYRRAGPNNEDLNGALVNDTLYTEKTNSGGGVYYLRYIHTASGCPTFRDTLLTIHPLPEPWIDSTTLMGNGSVAPYPFCVTDDPVELKGNPNDAGGVFDSDYSGAVSGKSFIPSGSPTSGPFWIRYSYTDGNKCRAADSVEVQVFAPPVINILNNDTAFCRHENMEMDIEFEVQNSDENNSGWIFVGDRLSPSNPLSMGFKRTIGIKSINDSTTVFSAVAFANDPNEVCPEASANLTITTHPVPDVTITPDDPDGCQPHDATFTTTFNNRIDSTTATYAWSFQDGGTSDIKNAFHSFGQTGPNGVNLTVTSAFGCDSTITDSIYVFPNPVAAFVPDPNNSTTAALPKFTFTNKSGVEDILNSEIVTNFWDFGDLNMLEDTSFKKSPTWIYGTDTATYYVRLFVETNHGCKDSIMLPVVVGPDILVFIPNAFTPNESGPGANDGFHAVTNDGVDSYHLIIFNRWGELLWETHDKTEKWDGTFGGQPVQQDVYSYYLEVTSWSGKPYKYKGTVTLLR